jgi:3-oxoacyl-[acyl-carrier-protein] synthase II
MMNGRRVVVTGLGAVTPLGCSADAMWQGLIAGKSGVGPITRFDTTGYRCRVAAQVNDFPLEELRRDKNIRQMDRFVLYAVHAAREAFRQSGLNLERDDPDRIGVLIGSGIGGIGVVEEEHTIMKEKGHRKVTPYLIPKLIPNMAPGLVSIDLHLKGPNSAVATACATGTHAIGDAYRIIQRDEAEAMVCGGAESCITALAVAGFANMRALTERNDDPPGASSPFDKRRDGFVMGEGAGVVVLEELEHAQARGAEIFCEIIGYGMSGDAYHITAPAPGGEGGARAMRAAVKSAKLAPEAVQYVNAHGTSTPLNDKLETQAIKTVFGEHAYKMAISSNKSMLGHLIGAAGAVEAIATVKTIYYGIIPPTINYLEPDPECDLDYVPNEAREQAVEVAISNSLGFGGHNCTIVLKKHR